MQLPQGFRKTARGGRGNALSSRSPHPPYRIGKAAFGLLRRSRIRAAPFRQAEPVALRPSLAESRKKRQRPRGAAAGAYTERQIQLVKLRRERTSSLSRRNVLPSACSGAPASGPRRSFRQNRLLCGPRLRSHARKGQGHGEQRPGLTLSAKSNWQNCGAKGQAPFRAVPFCLRLAPALPHQGRNTQRNEASSSYHMTKLVPHRLFSSPNQKPSCTSTGSRV